MSQAIDVGMADYKIAKSPASLVVVGLGSCIAICLYDAGVQVGGMAHIMLPVSDGLRGDPKKYADTSIQIMLEELLSYGARKSRITAKITGGSQMFAFTGKSTLLRVGDQNTIAVEKELKRMGIPILASDTGGNQGRRVSFDLSSGQLSVRMINRSEKVI